MVGESTIDMTLSGGCALGPGNSVQTLVDLADRCLYQAKVGGRNRSSPLRCEPTGS